MHQVFAVLSSVQGFVTLGVGVYAVFKSGYKPQRMTRFIYVLMTLMFVSTLASQGSWDALYLAGTQAIGTILFFILSLKYGMGGMNRLDLFTFFGFLVSLVVWKMTSNPTLALYLAILTEAIGFIPTIEKTWRMPWTEDWRFYFSDVLAGAFSILSVSVVSLENYAFPLYIFLLNLLAMILIIWRGKVVSRPKSSLS